METKPITVQGVKEMLKKELSNKLESCEIDNTKDLCEFIDICMSSFHNAELPSGWISVEDRLPDLNKQVIGYFPNGIEGSSGKEEVSTAICYNGKKLHSDFPNSTASHFEATHWQPLPQPPIENQLHKI